MKRMSDEEMRAALGEPTTGKALAVVGDLMFHREENGWAALGDTCPFCGYYAPSVYQEVKHMQAEHPEVIDERLAGEAP